MPGDVPVSGRGLLLVSLLLVGCVPPQTLLAPREAPPAKYQEFFRLPLYRQGQEIKNYSIEEQIDIYLYAVQKKHPPVLGFAYDIARSGAAAVPIVIQRLRDAQSDLTKADLIYVFEAMAVLGSYDVKGDPEVMRALKEAVSTMRWEATKERSQASIQVILREDATRR